MSGLLPRPRKSNDDRKHYYLDQTAEQERLANLDDEDPAFV